MARKLFVGNLPYTVDDAALKEGFGEFGEVVSANVIKDRETGRPRGFGFVEFSSEESAKAAVVGLDGQEFQGRAISVREAEDRRRAPGGPGGPRSGPPPRSGGGYGGGGGGGYGGGGGGYGGGGGGYGGPPGGGPPGGGDAPAVRRESAPKRMEDRKYDKRRHKGARRDRGDESGRRQGNRDYGDPTEDE